MKNGIELIAEERDRQISVEGWTPEHDDGHHTGDLILASIAYADYAWFLVYTGREDGEAYFGGDPPNTVSPPPWGEGWWKPDWLHPIRNLVKAGALIAAEIDRLQRKAATDSPKRSDTQDDQSPNKTK